LTVWYLFLTFFTVGASPTMWLFSALAAIGDPSYLRASLYGLGFNPGLLRLSYLLLPLGATLLSLALIPLAAAWIGRLNPRDR
ncbi:hypothetical protein, partial [Pseudomonas sp. PNPG3]|uniref:hypothetical protein n=1 Tax=Pseudomonas sp. PNPG3 TaxID=2919497 RepID=UPI001FFD0FBF